MFLDLCNGYGVILHKVIEEEIEAQLAKKLSSGTYIVYNDPSVVDELESRGESIEVGQVSSGNTAIYINSIVSFYNFLLEANNWAHRNSEEDKQNNSTL